MNPMNPLNLLNLLNPGHRVASCLIAALFHV